MLQMQILTSINTWAPSVHLLQNKTILLAIADELRIHKDITYGVLKRASDKIIEEGEFVSLMLCSAKFPFRTELTIFARRNGFCYLKIVDDLRQETNANSLLGVAVMQPGLVNNSLGYKLQLVVLDTLVHKNEKFIVREPIIVKYGDPYYRGCALVSQE